MVLGVKDLKFQWALVLFGLLRDEWVPQHKDASLPVQMLALISIPRIYFPSNLVSLQTLETR